MKLIDSNIFLEVLLDQSKSENCEKFLNKIAANKEQAIITDFTVDAICVVLGRETKNPKLIRQFLTSLFGYVGLKNYITTIQDKFLATKLMEEQMLDFDDALTLQAVYSNNIRQIVSYDKHFDKVKDIERIEP